MRKTCLTICVRKGEKAAFSCTLSVLAKTCLGPKQSNSGKTIKIVVSAEIAQNQNRVHAKGVVLCERTCFCLLSTF